MASILLQNSQNCFGRYAKNIYGVNLSKGPCGKKTTAKEDGGLPRTVGLKKFICNKDVTWLLQNHFWIISWIFCCYQLPTQSHSVGFCGNHVTYRRNWFFSVPQLLESSEDLSLLPLWVSSNQHLCSTFLHNPCLYTLPEPLNLFSGYTAVIWDIPGTKSLRLCVRRLFVLPPF